MIVGDEAIKGIFNVGLGNANVLNFIAQVKQRVIKIIPS
jgi:hypothetical protein